MAQQYTTDSGTVLEVPGAYVKQNVIANAGGTAAAGVITLIGEAEEGPDYTQESDLDSNGYGPDQIQDVQNKYGSGHLVDAFRAAITAAADDAIVGAVSLVKFIKTNKSTASAASVVRSGFGSYTTLTARRQGAPGNLIKYRSEVSQAETPPTTGPWTYAPLLTGSSTFKLRTNGATQETVVLSALTDGPSFASSIESYSNGIMAQGGTLSDPLTGLSGVTITAASPSAGVLTVTLAAASLYNPAPAVGDTVVIPLTGQYGAAADSAIKGTASANVGSYVVTGVVNTASSAVITMKALNVTGTPVGATGSIGAGQTDIIVFKPITITNQTGQNRNAAQGVTGTWNTTSNDGTNVVVTAPAAWAANPQVGDTMVFPATFAGITAGFYEVTSSTNTTVSFSRLSNGTAGTTGSASGPATFTVEKPDMDGVGKTLEVAGDVTSFAKTSTGIGATWSNQSLTSASEYVNLTTVTRGTSSSAYTTGGEIVLKAGSTNGAVTMVVSSTGVALYESTVLKLQALRSQVTTMQALVDLINSQTGYTASLGSAKFSAKPLSILDQGTYTLNTDPTLALQTARVKHDADAWNTAMSGNPLATPSTAPTSGLPGVVVPDQFLTGGAKGASSSMGVADAFDAASEVDTNFVNPLFSQDASADIADGETDAASTYTIDAINSLCKSHVIENSTEEAEKFRIGFTSKLGPYAIQKEAAGELSYFRVAFTIQDQKLVGSDGLVHTYQPWMSGVLAAGMQAAAGFKGIVKKFVNTNGASQRAGDWNSKSLTAKKDALSAGILFTESVKTGGTRWVSDQTTYTVDNNFVFNSLQAVYLSDLMSSTLKDRYDRAVVGKSIAEISAAGALSFLGSIMFDFLRLKWIAPSDDGAPKGYKNATVKVNGPVMKISLEAKINGILYFVPISFNISEVSQSASSGT